MLIFKAIGVFTSLFILVNCYTREETKKIEQLSNLLGDGGEYKNFYKDYMKKPLFLHRFLKDQDFNVDEAKSKLIRMLQWRKAQNIDGIIGENFGDWPIKYPYYIDGNDKEGRPLLQVLYGQWDVRRIMLAGHRDKLARYSDQLLEKGYREILKLNDEGKNVTKGVVLIDLNNFNQKTHGCAACLPFYYDLLVHYERYYPESVQNFNFVNVPRIFEMTSKYILTIISQTTKKIIQIYGYDREEWRTELGKTIDLDQLLTQFGGTRKIKLVS